VNLPHDLAALREEYFTHGLRRIDLDPTRSVSSGFGLMLRWKWESMSERSRGCDSGGEWPANGANGFAQEF
jgi:hypothetical protein